MNFLMHYVLFCDKIEKYTVEFEERRGTDASHNDRFGDEQNNQASS